MKNIKFLIAGDLHLGNTRVSANTIIDRFKKIVFNKITNDNIDMIIFNGDVLDKELSFSENSVKDILKFFSTLDKLCLKHNVMMVFMKGTDTHDHEQIESIMSILTCDARYYDTVSVDTILGHTFLFVPDNLFLTNGDYRNEIDKVLCGKKVDFSLVHGTFDFQLLGVETLKHDSEYFESITNHYTLTSHIHQFQQHGNIISIGSFDRFTFGDEGDKCLLLVEINPNYGKRFEMLVNRFATQFVDITVNKNDTYANIEDRVNKAKLGTNISVRLIDKDGTGIIQSYSARLSKDIAGVKATYKKAVLTKSVEDKINNKPMKGFAITSSNIVELVKQELANDDELIAVKTLMDIL